MILYCETLLKWLFQLTGDFLWHYCCEAREALRADFAKEGVFRLASKSLISALAKLSAQVALLL